MIKLQTVINCPELTDKIDWDSTVCSVGSCFSEHFIIYLKELGIATANNPSGIIYNTDSIAKISERVATNKRFTETDFFEFQGVWKSWLHHGGFAKKSLPDAIEVANKNLDQFHQKVIDSKLFIITPSTSMVYIHNKTQKIVANCHRVPNHQFSTKLLTLAENRQNLQKTVSAIRLINKSCQIVLTLSPVRHNPGELTLNSRSKAILLEAIHQTVETNKNCIYFPSYEIMLDELRDYRFYKDDMLHPTALAREIIFQHFLEKMLTKEALITLTKRKKASKHNAHRPRS